MILYRKTQQLRVRRSAVPEPPFWAATTLVPYGSRRAAPLAIDFVTLAATAADRLEVTVVENAVDQLERLERKQPIHDPVLIDGAEMAESVFARGAELLRAAAQRSHPATLLASTRTVLPHPIPPGSSVAIAAWPVEFGALDALFATASRSGAWWGVLVPVIFPVTTELALLERLAELSQTHGAAFLAASPVDVEATARMALAQSLGLGSDDDEYAMLFHASLDPIHVATERHVAALAESIGIADFVLPPRWDERSNWNAAVLLTLTASRMIAMEHDIELASDIARSARLVATLDKPLSRIAASAHLGIIEGLDDVSAEILGEWLEREQPEFVERINRRWRLRRDHGV